MPVSGNPYGVLKRALRRTVSEKLEVHRAVAATVKELIVDQFGFGIDPYGKSQPWSKGKASGLMSTKLGRAIGVKPDATGITGIGELKSSGISRRRKAQGKAAPPARPRRQWLNAHQEGHVWPPRTVEGQRRFFDAKGKRVHATRFRALVTEGERERVVSSWWGLRKQRKVIRRAGASRRVVVGQREAYWEERKNRSVLKGTILNVRSHTIRERVLRPRLIYPVGRLGDRWGNAIKATIAEVRGKQLRRNVERG